LHENRGKRCDADWLKRSAEAKQKWKKAKSRERGSQNKWWVSVVPKAFLKWPMRLILGSKNAQRQPQQLRKGQ